MAADAEATLPALIEAVKRLVTADRRRAFEERGAKLADASRAALRARARRGGLRLGRGPDQHRAPGGGSVGADPEAKTGRSSTATRAAGRSACGISRSITSTSACRAASGIGYGAPASVGAALANRKYGRLSVAIQNDGDLMYAPGVLWTAAHHRIPILIVMNNNRAYHEEVMHVQRMGNRRERGVDRAHIGNDDQRPGDRLRQARAEHGRHAEGPITNPNDLGPALRRAIAAVKSGEPALVDVVTQPR